MKIKCSVTPKFWNTHFNVIGKKTVNSALVNAVTFLIFNYNILFMFIFLF